MMVMKRFFDKQPIWFAVVWIAVYVLAFGNADSLSETLGIPKLLTCIVGAVLTAVLVLFLGRHGLLGYCGLRKMAVSWKSVGYFLPVIVLSTVNFWCGLQWNMLPLHTALYILSMVFVAVLEEVIFRGLLFRAMLPSGRGAAILVSSLTFGVGHIVNLLLGAELLSTALQLVHASAIGFCFTAVFLVTGSILPCILAHAFINCTSVFAVQPSAMGDVVVCVVISVLAVGYGWWLLKKREILLERA